MSESCRNHKDHRIERRSGIEKNTISQGIGLGIKRSKEIDIEQNDLVVLYTDGIIEAENSAREQFGYHRLKDVVKSHRHLSAESIKEELIRQLREHVNADHFEDDVTFLIIKIE